MKIPTHPERRQLLALLAAGLLPAPIGRPGLTGDVGPIQSLDRVRIRARGLPPHSPLLTDMRAVLRPTLTARGLESLIGRVRETLTQEYGSQVSEEAQALQYVWVWTGERWILICLAASLFEVDFGARGLIEVEVADATPMR